MTWVVFPTAAVRRVHPSQESLSKRPGNTITSGGRARRPAPVCSGGARQGSMAGRGRPHRRAANTRRSKCCRREAEWSPHNERPFSGERHVSDVDEVEAVIASLRQRERARLRQCLEHIAQHLGHPVARTVHLGDRQRHDVETVPVAVHLAQLLRRYLRDGIGRARFDRDLLGERSGSRTTGVTQRFAAVPGGSTTEGPRKLRMCRPVKPCPPVLMIASITTSGNQGSERAARVTPYVGGGPPPTRGPPPTDGR